VQLPRAAKIGLAVVVVGILAPITLSIWKATIHFVPVYEPIALTPGHLQQPFTLNFSGFYVIEIEAERKLPHETLQCLLGLQDDVHDGHCKDIAPVLQFSWKLTGNGQTIQTGSSAKIIGGSYTDATVASEFTSFEGKRGQQYTLDIDFWQDGSKLSVANPKLRIGVDGMTYEDFIVFDLMSLAFAAICCLVGGAMFLISIAALRRRNKQAVV
jgi:hypothetical protein